MTFKLENTKSQL